jgi:hypothetical protein
VDELTTGRSRVPRLLSRALLVLGGAVAASAAAWALSGATASAATLPGAGLTGLSTPDAVVSAPVSTPTPTPAADQLITSVGDSLTGTPAGATSAAGQVVGAVSSPVVPVASAVRSAAELSPVGSVTGRLRAAVAQVDSTIPVQVNQVAAVHPGFTPSAGLVRSGGAKAHPGSPVVLGPGRPAGAQFPAVPVLLSRASDPVGVLGVVVSAGLPVGPTTPQCQQCLSAVAPAGAGGSGAGGQQGPGGSTAGLPFGQPVLPGLLSIGAAAQRDSARLGAPGRQPGVTPD